MILVLALVTVVSFGAAVFAILRMPSWLLSDGVRDVLWRHRYALYDARRRGVLPHCEAVSDLLARYEQVIAQLPSVSPGWVRRARRTGPAEPLATFDVSGFDASQRATFDGFVRHLEAGVVRQYVLGSWAGLVVEFGRRLGLVFGAGSADRRSEQIVTLLARST